jgi:hypothetical protein
MVADLIGKLKGENRKSNTFNGKAIKKAKVILLRLAYTLGKISPNIKIKKVTTTTSNRKRTGTTPKIT